MKINIIHHNVGDDMENKLTNEQLAALKTEAKDLLNQLLIKLEVLDARDSYEEKGDFDSEDEWIVTKAYQPDGVYLSIIRDYISSVVKDESVAVSLENVYYSSSCW